MTEPKDDVPGATEDESASDASPESDPTQPVDLPLPDETALGSDPEAARAEAEAAALAANEVDSEEGSADDKALEADADIDDDSSEDGADADDTSDVAVAELAGAGAAEAAGTTAADRRSGRAAREARAAAANAAIPVDPSIRVRDNASKLFVIGTILVFALIFLNGMLLGTGGVFRPYVTPSPEPSASTSIGPSASLAPSGSVAGSGSPAASGSVGASVSTAPSPPVSTSPGPS